MATGDIDVQHDLLESRNVRLPFFQLTAGLMQDPLPHLIDDADLFGLGDEFRRRKQSAFRMVPSNKGLEPTECLVACLDDRLVMQREFSFLYPQPQLIFKLQRRDGLLQHVRIKHLHAPTTAFFAVFQGHFGIAQQIIGGIEEMALDDETDADLDADRNAIDDHWLLRCALPFPGGSHHLIITRGVFQQNGKRVPVQACGHSGLLAVGLQSSGQFNQNPVADMVAISIVDAFETVDVEQ